MPVWSEAYRADRWAGWPNTTLQQAEREAATICPRPCKLTFDLLTLIAVSESRMTWATSVPILVFLGLSVLDLGPMYVTDRHTSDAHHRLMPPALWGRGIIIIIIIITIIRRIWGR